MPDKLTKNELNRKAATAGTVYVIVQLLVRGITFLLTPVYTRLVSTAQYGEIRTYESWLLIVIPILSLPAPVAPLVAPVPTAAKL